MVVFNYVISQLNYLQIILNVQAANKFAFDGDDMVNAVLYAGFTRQPISLNIKRELSITVYTNENEFTSLLLIRATSVPIGTFTNNVYDDNNISVGPNTFARVLFTLSFDDHESCDNRVLLVIILLLLELDILELSVLDTRGFALNIFGILISPYYRMIRKLKRLNM